MIEFGMPKKGDGFAWYKTLEQEQRINLKDCMILVCGVSWENLTKLGFGFIEKIEILHSKLKREGFDV